MKKPTVEQMKKRPSLWTTCGSLIAGYVIIVYPDGSNEYMWDCDNSWSKGGISESWEWVQDDFEFVSWL